MLVEVPGTKGAPRAFYETLIEWICEEMNFVRSREDRCLVHHAGADGEQDMNMAFHVDDGVGFAESVEKALAFAAKLEERFSVKFEIVPRGQPDDFAGMEWTEYDDYCEVTQHPYIKEKLHEVPITAKRAKQLKAPVTDDERTAMRKVGGEIRWVHKTVVDVGYDLNRLATWTSMPECTVEQINRMNKVVRLIKNGRRPHDGEARLASIRLPRFEKEADLKVTFIADAGEPTNDALYRGKWHGCKVVGIQQDDWSSEDFGMLYHQSALTRRVSNSSMDGECNVFIEGLDVALSCAMLLDEFESGVRPSLWELKKHGLPRVDPLEDLKIPIEGHTDSNDLVEAARSLVFSKSISKRRKADICDIQELQDIGVLREVVKIAGTANPTNAGTKKLSYEDYTMGRLRELAHGRYEVVQS